MLGRAAHLPDAVVGLLPTVLEEIEKCEDQVARAGIGFVDAEPPGLVEGVDDLSVHVELELLGRRVAHSDGREPSYPGSHGTPHSVSRRSPRVRT